MAETELTPERHLLPGRAAFWALLALAVYFGVMLIPKWWPAFGQTAAFFVYVLSLPVAILGLAALTCWGVVGTFIAKRRQSTISRFHRRLLLVSLAGFLLFVSSMVIVRFIDGGLPTGSNILRFEAATWRATKSADFVTGDITPRQKMLGDVVAHVLPGRTRTEIEELLGPSLATSYFENTGRDLIYVLGAERDSFFPIDSEWLLIWFDEAGRFQRYAVYTD